MSSTASVGSRGSWFLRSARRLNIRSKQKSKKEKNVIKISRTKKKSISLEDCIDERDWDGALRWLLWEENIRDDLSFAWSLDSRTWRDDYTHCNIGSGSSLNMLAKACQSGAPIELINRIMMMYPLMIKSVTPSGKTILHAACEGGASTKVMESLCDEVLRVAPFLLLAEDNLGMTAMQYCLFNKDADPDTISALREAFCELEDGTSRTECDDFPIRLIDVGCE
jgi:hypothetical protein